VGRVDRRGTLAALVPFDAVSLERHPGPIKGVVMVPNVGVVVYLAVRRVESGEGRVTTLREIAGLGRRRGWFDVQPFPF
jgi:hypothetical protein